MTKNKDEIGKDQLIEWRKEKTVEKIDRPTKIARARSIGYKAKNGISVARVRIRKGGRRRPLYGRGGRKPKKAGLIKFTPKGLKWMAEERVSKKFPNMEVLNSYYLAEDGKSKWFEVILVDPNNPSIKSDKELKWITKPAHRRRVLRGLTSAGKKSRGL